VVQIGTQQKSWDIYERAVEAIRAGRLGDISHVEVWDNENHFPGYGRPADSNPPSELDWEMFLGPAPAHAFNPNRYDHHYWFFDYGGGWTLDWAVHHYDIVQWAMDVKAPVSATASGGKLALVDDDREWPDTLSGVVEYGPGPVAKRGFLMQYTTRSGGRGPDRGHGKAFHGTDASMVLDRSGYTLTGELRDGKKVVLDERVTGISESAAVVRHARNFLGYVKSRKRPLADVEVGHDSTNPGHLLNISWRVGRKIRWDAQREQILDDPEANALVSRAYRAPWSLPV
jgi:predicted dehydrogenase